MDDKLRTPEYTRIADALEVVRVQKKAGVSYRRIAADVERLKGEIHGIEDRTEREKLFGLCYVLLTRDIGRL